MSVLTPQAAVAEKTADVRPYVIRTYDRWIILAIVMLLGWFLFRPLIAFTVFYRGVSFERMLRLGAAEHYYRKSTRIYARIPQGWQGWGELYLMRAPGDRLARQTAIAVFEKGISYNPSYAPLEFDLGRAYYVGHEYLQARDAFLQSAHLAPSDIFSWDWAAWSSLHGGDVPAALEYWHEVLRIDPGNAVARRQIARYRT